MTSYTTRATWKGEHWGHLSCSNGAELDFSAPPALGVTWSLYARPFQTSSGEWKSGPAPAAMAAPIFDPPTPLATRRCLFRLTPPARAAHRQTED